MVIEDENLFSFFLEDFALQMTNFDHALLCFLRSEDDPEGCDELFRVFHSMKSIFLTVEFTVVGNFFHRIETVFKAKKNGELKNQEGLYEFLVRLKEALEDYYKKLQDKQSVNFDTHSFEEELEKFESAIVTSQAPVTVHPRQALYEALKRSELSYLDIIDGGAFKGYRKLLRNFNECSALASGLEDERINELFEGICRLVEDYESRHQPFDHLSEGLVMETFDWAAKLLDLKQVFSAEDDRNLLVHIDMLKPQRLRYLKLLSEEKNVTSTFSSQKLGEILVSQGKVNEEAIQEVIEKQKEGKTHLKLGEALVAENKVRVKDIATALQVQESRRTDDSYLTFIRIPERKVDVLVDGMEELMILQSQLKEKLRKRWLESDTSTKLQLDRIDRLLIMLQHQAVSFRMDSLESTFKKIEIVGRSVAKELGKSVAFELSGLEIEVNRSIVERLQSPIVHLIRNALYHGIENVEDRVSAGKNPVGKLKVKGQIIEGQLSILIEDDGSGLDLKKILNKARQLNLIKPDRTYSDWEIVDFIFEPGFSTNEQVDQISGRGLGMNIVESEVKALGGHIQIKNRPGQGVSFILMIPMHLNQLEGTLIRIEDENLIIPSAHISAVWQANALKWDTEDPIMRVMTPEKEVMPVVCIREMLELSPDLEKVMEGDVVVISRSGVHLALPVSEIIEKRTVFINPIEDSLRAESVFQGVCVMNDHEFALIIDTEKLFEYS